MRIDYDSCSKLEDIKFKYERLEALLSCMQAVVAEVVEVSGLPEHALEYGLFELEEGLHENNKKFGEIMYGAKFIKEVAS